MYSLEVSVDECTFTQDISVEFVNCEDCPVYIPNSFSPNADGLNDVFLPSILCPFNTYRLQVFDRWGNQVFASNDPDRAWEGSFRSQSLKEGIYVYLLELEFGGEAKRRSVLKGDIALLR